MFSSAQKYLINGKLAQHHSLSYSLILIEKAVQGNKKYLRTLKSCLSAY